jgi:hypothetical protein
VGTFPTEIVGRFVIDPFTEVLKESKSSTRQNIKKMNLILEVK